MSNPAMTFFKNLSSVVTLTVLGLGCGVEKENPNTNDNYVAGVPSLNYNSVFTCRRVIDGENETDELAKEFELSKGRIIVVYQIYADANNVKVATARIEQSSRILSSSKYFQDVNNNSDLSLLADVIGSDNNGSWQFFTSQQDKQTTASFTYSDPEDLDSAINASFLATECEGSL